MFVGFRWNFLSFFISLLLGPVCLSGPIVEGLKNHLDGYFFCTNTGGISNNTTPSRVIYVSCFCTWRIFNPRCKISTEGRICGHLGFIVQSRQADMTLGLPAERKVFKGIMC